MSQPFEKAIDNHIKDKRIAFLQKMKEHGCADNEFKRQVDAVIAEVQAQKAKMSLHDIDLACFYAFRYALGRTSYAVSEVADLLCRNWHLIDENHQKLIHKEIDEALELRRAGHPCDEDQWRMVRAMKVKPR